MTATTIKTLSIAMVIAFTFGGLFGIQNFLVLQDADAQGGDNRFGPNNKDFPGDNNQGGGNDPPRGAPGQTNNPHPSR